MNSNIDIKMERTLVQENGSVKNLSLTDYFAARAMESFVTREGHVKDYDLSRVAKWSYDVADAMTKERSERYRHMKNGKAE